MLGTDCDRFAETKRIGFERARFAGTPLTFIRHQDGRLARSAHEVGERAIGCRGAGTRIDKEEHSIRLRYRRCRLRLHSPRKALALGIFETGGVDQLEREITEPTVTFSPIARDARPIVDQREMAADEAVEQRRFAHIGAADDHEGKTHGRNFAKQSRISFYPIEGGKRATRRYEIN
jgi:hypothetical protein